MKAIYFSVKLLYTISLTVVWGMQLASAQKSPGCFSANDGRSDGPAVIGFWAKQFAASVNRGGMGWDSLDQTITLWNSPDCFFDDGRPKLSVLLPGYSVAFGMEPDWSKSLERVNTLKQSYPNSAFALLAEAKYWSAFAWNARGPGFASTVTPDGWRLFKERMEKAEQILIEIKPVATALPNWYELMIEVQSALGRPPGERDKTFIEGATRFKTYFPIYFQMENYLEPKWGGSWEAVEKFVAWSVDNTKGTEGQTMYARLYWFVAQGVTRDENLFKETQAKWPKMKGGFEDMMKRHPKSKWNLNNFAAFACLAGDKEMFLSLRKKIDRDVYDAAWANNNSLDLCENKYGYQQ